MRNSKVNGEMFLCALGQSLFTLSIGMGTLLTYGSYIKEDKNIAANTEDSIVDDTELSLEDLEATIKDKDFSDFEDFLEEEAAADERYLAGVDT